VLDRQLGIDIIGGLERADIVEIEPGRFEADERLPLPRPRALGPLKSGVPADEIVRVGVDVEVASVGPLEEVRGVLLDVRDGGGRAVERRDAAEQPALVRAVGGAELRVAGADERALRQQARERRSSEVALDRGCGRAEHGRTDLMLDARDGPRR
jgi:hypothetical protein